MVASAVTVVGFHGQTVLHRPDRGVTVQLGNGPALAARLGIPVVYDLRGADVAAGGQGAPVVPVFHRAMVRLLRRAHPVAVLNLGGVANLTFIDGEASLLAFDTGPGNALIDDFLQQRSGQLHDDGRRARGAGLRLPGRAVAQGPAADLSHHDRRVASAHRRRIGALNRRRAAPAFLHQGMIPKSV
jgi:anhydro-N-acetylmuramic acid kinase